MTHLFIFIILMTNKCKPIWKIRNNIAIYFKDTVISIFTNRFSADGKNSVSVHRATKMLSGWRVDVLL